MNGQWRTRRAKAALVFGGWTIVAALVAAGYGAADAFTGFIETLQHFLPYYWLWAALTPAAIAGAGYIRARVRGLPATLLAHVALALAISCTQILLYAPLEIWLHREWGEQLRAVVVLDALRRHLFGNILTYALAMLVWYADAYRLRLNAELGQAKLEMLRMQLQPHFLFNTLQAVSSTMRSDPDGAERMIERLGDFLRILLRRDVRQVVPIAEEMELLGHYVAIMKSRMGSRLEVVTRLDPSAARALVPVMLLQPLVENAISHGIGDRASGGRVTVEIHLQGQSVQVEIEDDGAGLAGPLVEGVGLRNTRQRMDALYPGSHRLSVTARSTGGTLVSITVPFATA